MAERVSAAPVFQVGFHRPYPSHENADLAALSVKCVLCRPPQSRTIPISKMGTGMGRSGTCQGKGID